MDIDPVAIDLAKTALWLEAGGRVPLRLRQLPFALRTHPPLRLRHWWIRTAPWAEAR